MEKHNTDKLVSVFNFTNEYEWFYICGTLRSWGHLSFNYYLVKTDPMLHIFGSKIISLTFLDILNANLSKIETRISHL